MHKKSIFLPVSFDNHLLCFENLDYFHMYNLNEPLFQVISRIFYSINRSWSGRISLPEFRRSNFQQVSK